MTFLDAIVVGAGFSVGYTIVTFAITNTINRIRVLVAVRQLNKQRAQINHPPPPKPKSTKLCTKCKKNERPATGLYCQSCQFDI